MSENTGSGTTLFCVRIVAGEEEDGTGRYIVAAANEKLLQISRWGKPPARASARYMVASTLYILSHGAYVQVYVSPTP